MRGYIRPTCSAELARKQFGARAMCMASVTLKDALLPFQREGVAAAVERWDGRILLGDEMGLGKTIQVSPTG